MQNKKEKYFYKKKIEELQKGQNVQKSESCQRKKIDKVQSARQTRIRKKLYIKLLESKLTQRDKQLSDLRNQFQALKEQKTIKNSSMYEAVHSRNLLFKSVEESVRKQDQQATKTFLDALRLRLGIAGDQRVTMLDKTVAQFVECMMPMHFRFLLQYCNQRKQFYELFSESSEYKIHMNFSFLNEIQKKQLTRIRQQLCEHKKVYDNLIYKIQDLKQLVLKQNECSQKIIDNLRKTFQPCFVAEFLLKLDQRRNLDYKFTQIYPLNFLQKYRLKKQSQAQQYISSEISRYSCEKINQDYPMRQDDDFNYLL